MKHAKDLEGNEISIDEANRKTNYYCVICDSPVVVKKGAIKEHHFAHYHNSGADCELKYNDKYGDKSKEAVYETIISAHNDVNYEVKFSDTLNFNEGQLNAWNMIMDWIDNKNKREFVLSGYSGTGKTYILSKLIQYMRKKQLSFNIMSFTGKAVDVLRGRGIYEAQTIHSTIYEPTLDDDGNIVKWNLSDVNLRDFIIIDEYSMLNKVILEDLRRFNKKILFTGDHFQLPSLNKDDNGLKEQTDITLTEVVRQALNNPIIKWATKLRNGDNIHYVEEETEEGSIKIISKNDKRLTSLMTEVDQILCGRNTTRNKINNYFREKKNRLNPLPYPNEKIICLRNNRNMEVFNGQIFNVKFADWNSEHRLVDQKVFDLVLDDNTKVTCSSELFRDSSFKIKPIQTNNANLWSEIATVTFFDYAYGITVHKSQGSEFDSVLLLGYDGDWMGDEFSQWLYSGLTRAKKHAIIVI